MKPNQDSELYRNYGYFISSTYPLFLKKYGIKNIAGTASGSVITDSQGQEYIDCVSGYGLFNIGHNHPQMIRDIKDQLDKRQLFTKPLISKIQVKAAQQLASLAPDKLECSFLCNSGSEAIDSALKLARLYTGKSEIITAENSFHGFTYGALSASGIESFKKFFKPMVPDIRQVKFGDIQALEKKITPDTAAILLEPMQHESGIDIPDQTYFQKVRNLCTDNNILLILDEIKTGMGKTGRMFACEHFSITPDILVIGKSLGGGLMPVGAIIARKKIWRKFSLSFPMAASSFAGNILACRAILSTIEIIEKDNLISKCKQKGRMLITGLKEIAAKYEDLIINIKGRGLLIGIRIVNSRIALQIIKEMIASGILVFQAYADNETIMVEPPLVISNNQIRKIISTLDEICQNIEDQKNEKM
jgi:putrescine aminotransferase